MCCAPKGVDECSETCPTCADSGSGNVCTRPGARPGQVCKDPDSSRAGDWRCECAAQAGKFKLGGSVVCAPPATKTDIIIATTNTDEGDLSNKIAEMLGLSPKDVVATTDGLGAGQARVVLLNDNARASFLATTANCQASQQCRESGVNGLNKDLTQCDALAHGPSCTSHGSCVFQGGRCLAAPNLGTPAPATLSPGQAAAADGDDSGFQTWWLIVIILGVLLLCALLALLWCRGKEQDRRATQPMPEAPNNEQPEPALDETQRDNPQAFYSDGEGSLQKEFPNTSYTPKLSPIGSHEYVTQPLIGSPLIPQRRSHRPPPLAPTLATTSYTPPLPEDTLPPLGAGVTSAVSPQYTYVPRSTASPTKFSRLPV